MRWVWEANRGSPVGGNATLTFGTDGNLVLADADGRVAWQTNTANKGVVSFKLLPTGNMVLYDSKGSFVWQSFDDPTDTLLVGQSLYAGGVSKLVSRASEKENKHGPYSFVMEPKGLFLYYKSNNSPKSLLYSQLATVRDGPLDNVTLSSAPEQDEGYRYELTLELYPQGGIPVLDVPKFNSTLTYLRLGIDGNIKLHTYYGAVDSWELTFTLFDRDSVWETECQLPSRCGEFGVCENNKCVACPLSNGLVGWNTSCVPEMLTSCDPKTFHYYKVEGVDYFFSKYTRGSSTKETEAWFGIEVILKKVGIKKSQQLFCIW